MQASDGNERHTEHERAYDSAAVAPAASSIRITPPGRWPSIEWRSLWEYRELVYFLAWRDVKVRYKQTALGAAWAILQPLFMMVVFSIFLGRLAGVPSDGAPYPIFVFAALLPWQLFSQSVTESSQSLVANDRLISKVYFPRIAIPLASLASSVIDFCIASFVLAGMMLYYGIRPAHSLLLLPPMIALALFSALAVGLWLSALNVQYRDVRYTLTFLTQLWLFASPVAYPSSLVPERWRALYGLNPMAGVVEGFRWTLLGTATPPGPMLAVSILAVAVLFAGGLLYFRKMENSFADLI